MFRDQSMLISVYMFNASIWIWILHELQTIPWKENFLNAVKLLEDDF